MQTYIVQKGDTLYGISKQFGITLEELKFENKLDSNSISIGQVLLIPTLETTTLYLVKKGDSLFSIAKKYDASVSEIIYLNGIKNNMIYPGQQLKIPINSTSQFHYIIYTVRKGDNLYSISKDYDISVSEIIDINHLDSNVLTIGQKLKIPVINIVPGTGNYMSYVVKSGDTIYSIAKNFNMSVDSLIRINNLYGDNLYIGQVIKVKKENKYTDLSGLSCYGSGYTEPSYVIHTVKRGDNLYDLSRYYGVSVDKLIKLNDLKNNNLYIGQILKIKEKN